MLTRSQSHRKASGPSKRRRDAQEASERREYGVDTVTVRAFLRNCRDVFPGTRVAVATLRRDGYIVSSDSVSYPPPAPAQGLVRNWEQLGTSWGPAIYRDVMDRRQFHLYHARDSQFPEGMEKPYFEYNWFSAYPYEHRPACVYQYDLVEDIPNLLMVENRDDGLQTLFNRLGRVLEDMYPEYEGFASKRVGPPPGEELDDGAAVDIVGGEYEGESGYIVHKNEPTPDGTHTVVFFEPQGNGDVMQDDIEEEFLQKTPRPALYSDYTIAAYVCQALGLNGLTFGQNFVILCRGAVERYLRLVKKNDKCGEQDFEVEGTKDSETPSGENVFGTTTQYLSVEEVDALKRMSDEREARRSRPIVQDALRVASVPNPWGWFPGARGGRKIRKRSRKPSKRGNGKTRKRRKN